jgi:hypothetical protein
MQAFVFHHEEHEASEVHKKTKKMIFLCGFA